MAVKLAGTLQAQDTGTGDPSYEGQRARRSIASGDGQSPARCPEMAELPSPSGTSHLERAPGHGEGSERAKQASPGRSEPEDGEVGCLPHDLSSGLYLRRKWFRSRSPPPLRQAQAPSARRARAAFRGRLAAAAVRAASPGPARAPRGSDAHLHVTELCGARPPLTQANAEAGTAEGPAGSSRGPAALRARLSCPSGHSARPVPGPGNWSAGLPPEAALQRPTPTRVLPPLPEKEVG